MGMSFIFLLLAFKFLSQKYRCGAGCRVQLREGWRSACVWLGYPAASPASMEGEIASPQCHAVLGPTSGG